MVFCHRAMFGLMTLWTSVEDGKKYGPALFIKILGHLQPKGPEGQMVENSPKIVSNQELGQVARGPHETRKGQRANQLAQPSQPASLGPGYTFKCNG
ncbi:hypothetical protein ACFXTH_041201 [Malus domestica]